MEKPAIENIKRNTDLIVLAEQAGAHFRKAGKGFASACPIHGGDNPTAFNVFTDDNGIPRFKCHTHGDQCNRFGSDAFAFLQALNGWDFKTALNFLGGVNPTMTAPPRPKPQPKPIELPSSEWQGEAWKFTDKASNRLFTDAGRVGFDYLTKRRALSVATCEAHWLGYAVYQNRPAVVIPWITKADEEIIAVKFRFLDDALQKDKPKYNYLPGSVQLIYGGWDAWQDDPALVIVEGEINALSIWQLKAWGVSVVSLGGQLNGRPELLRSLAQGRRRVFLWLDEPQASKRIEDILGVHCVRLQSPEMDGAKQDANQLLQEGELENFLRYAANVQ